MYCRYSKSSTSGTLCWCSTCNAQAQSACCAWFTALAVHDQLNHYSIVIFIWKKPVFIKHTVIVQYKSGTLISSCLASKKYVDLYSRFNLYVMDPLHSSNVSFIFLHLSWAKHREYSTKRLYSAVFDLFFHRWSEWYDHIDFN